MVFVDVPEVQLPVLHKAAQERNIILPAGQPLRLVTHLNIDDSDIELVIELFQQVFNT
jgi:threonine aldolase